MSPRLINFLISNHTQLENEPPLEFERMYCFDGNNSLKRIRTVQTRETADTRILESDYYIPREYVDRFANEVKTKKGPQVRSSRGETDEIDAPVQEEGTPIEGKSQGQSLDSCVRNWKAAADDDTKRMWGIFDEAGVFMSACRHGFILWIIDMIRSGEL